MSALYAVESQVMNSPNTPPTSVALHSGMSGGRIEVRKAGRSLEQIDAIIQSVFERLIHLHDSRISTDARIEAFHTIKQAVPDLQAVIAEFIEEFSQEKATSDDRKKCCASRIEAITRIGVEIKQAEELIVSERTLQGEALMSRLEEALARAEQSDTPVEAVAQAFADTERLYASDQRFRPFLLDARRLMSLFHDKPVQARCFILPLLHKVFVDNPSRGGLTPLEGSKFAARLVFVADHNLLDVLSPSFDDAYETIQEVVEEELDRIVDDYELERALYEMCVVYAPAPCHETLLPMRVAQSIMRDDGTLNLGIVDLVKQRFLSLKQQRDSVERHIVLKLHELKTNEKLLTLLETIPSPLGNGGRAIVNGVLRRASDCAVSAADTRCAILASFLTWWRQGSLGNCYVVSAAVQRQESVSEWLLEDFKELLVGEGAIIRKVGGSFVKFFGLQWPQKVVTDIKFSLENCEDVFACDAVKNALREVGCMTLENFKDAIACFLRDNPGTEPTLTNIFEGLIHVHRKPHDAVQRACCMAEGPGQNLLLRVWENAMGGMQFIPMMDTAIPTHVAYSRFYFGSIRKAFSETAKKYGLKRLQTALKTLLNQKSDTSSGTIVSSGLIPPSFQRLRACLVPQTVHSKEDLSWVLFQEREGQCIPFSDRQGLADFLENLFLEWAEIEEGKDFSTEARADLKSTSLHLLELFERHLLKKKMTQQWGVIHGMLCYSIDGAYAAGILEQKDFVISKPVKMGLGSVKSVAARAFLAWTGEMRRLHGDLPEISVLASSKDHVFRLLPNHPSIVGAMAQSADPIKDRELFATKIVSRSSHPAIYYIGKLSGLLDSFSSDIAAKRKYSPHAVNKKVVELINNEFVRINKEKCSIKDFLRIAWSALTSASKIYSSTPGVVDRLQTYFYLASLIKLVPDYQKQFIHFADTNWQCSFDARNMALQYCFWFNPVHRTWEVVDVSESGEVDERIEKESVDFLENLEIYPNIESLSRQIRQKQILDLDRKTRKALQKIERQFADSWAHLENESRKLRYDDLALLMGASSEMESDTLAVVDKPEIPPIVVCSDSWKSAFQRCENARQQYERIVEERVLRLASFGDEFRFSHHGSANPCLRYLTAGYDQFIIAVRGLIDPVAVAVCVGAVQSIV